MTTTAPAARLAATAAVLGGRPGIDADARAPGLANALAELAAARP